MTEPAATGRIIRRDCRPLSASRPHWKGRSYLGFNPFYCAPEDLETRRQEAQKKGLKPKYDGTCRNRTDQPQGLPSVVRFKAPLEGSVTVHDLLRGQVIFDNQELDDLIIQRTDGTPTYNFVVVVDDADMGITHVMPMSASRPRWKGRSRSTTCFVAKSSSTIRNWTI